VQLTAGTGSAPVYEPMNPKEVLVAGLSALFHAAGVAVTAELPVRIALQ
jgi:hypothetical protein